MPFDELRTQPFDELRTQEEENGEFPSLEGGDRGG